MNKYALTALAGGIAGIALAGCLGFAGLTADEIDPVKGAEVILVTEQPVIETEAEVETPQLPEPAITEEIIGDADPAEVEAQYPDMDFGELICGKDAAPAIDYDEEWGWWAYCEPAMVNEDGSLWQG